MPSGAGLTRAERAALGAILALTLWRLAWLPAAPLELYVDEAQYWLWGREMAAGAYSKPPLVGWLIRAATDLLGTDAPWAVRAPWPVVHGAAAAAVWALARRLGGGTAGALAGLTYATLPAVSLGAVLVTTDSPMMLALAVTLWLWHRQAAGAGAGGAVALGLAIGLGLWAKYAMLFGLAGLALAAVADPAWRLRLRDAALALGTAAAVFAPNLLWNLTHDLATLRHTAEIARDAGRLDWQGWAGFTASQLAVAGPVVFGALLAPWAARRRPPGLRGALVVATVILTIVMAQALRGGANANWAVGAYVPGAAVAALVLRRRPRLAAASLALNGTLALALPLVATQAATLRLPDGRLLMARHLGSEALAAAVLARAQAAGAGVIVSDDRALLAALTYATTRRGAPPAPPVRAVPGPEGPVASHYDLLYPLRAEPGPALWVGRTARAPACAGTPEPLPPGEGEITRRAPATALLPPACLDALRR